MKRLSSIFIFISLALLSLNYTFYHCIPSYNYKAFFRITSIIFLVISIFFNRNIRISPKIIFSLFFLFFGFLFNIETFQNIFTIFLVCYSVSINISDKKLKKYFFAIALLNILIFFLLRKLGVISDIYTNFDGRYRNSLGFDNPNALSVVFGSFFFFLMIIFEKLRGKFVIYACTLYLNYELYHLTGSRTLFYIVIFFVIMVILSELKITKNFVLKVLNNKFLMYLIIIGVFCSPFILYLLFPKNSVIDILLSYRITGITAFINQNKFLNFLLGFSDVPLIDNSFLALFYSVGIFIYIYIINLFIAFIQKTDSPMEKIIIISMLFFGVVESILIRPESLITLYFWILVLKSNKFIFISKDVSKL